MKKYSFDEQILLAVYAEWLRERPDFDRVNELNLHMEQDVFVWGLMKLTDAGLIKGVDWLPETANQPDKVTTISRSNLGLTGKGIERAQELAETERKRRDEAVKIVAGIFREVGIAAFSGLIIQ